MDIYPFDKMDRLSKEDYIKTQTKIASILRPDLKLKNLQTVLLKDWDRDARGKTYLTRQDIFNSLFELGDIWTPDVDLFQ